LHSLTGIPCQNTCASRSSRGRTFNKLVVVDEAHEYIESRDLIRSLVEVVRKLRHKGTNIMVASQNPPSVPEQLMSTQARSSFIRPLSGMAQAYSESQRGSG